MQSCFHCFLRFHMVFMNIFKWVYSVSVGHVMMPLGFSLTEENVFKYVFNIRHYPWDFMTSSLCRPKCQIIKYSKINNHLKHIGKNQRWFSPLMTVLYNGPDEPFSLKGLWDVPARSQRVYQRTDHSILPLILPPFSAYAQQDTDRHRIL